LRSESRGGLDAVPHGGRQSPRSPRFWRQDLYPDLSGKPAALCSGLLRGDGFVDGNERVAHAALEVFLVLDGYELEASVDEQERLFPGVAASQLDGDALVDWVRAHWTPR
jgi:death-on-curing protein